VSLKIKFVVVSDKTRGTFPLQQQSSLLRAV